jgi:hypothetical protein
VIRSPNPSDVSDQLSAIAAIAPDDVWAVGVDFEGPQQVPLALHWNGTVWTAIPTAGLPPNGGIAQFFAVSGAAADDVWSVGSYETDTGGSATLAVHWDGSAWTIAPTPNLSDVSQLRAVSAPVSSRAFAGGQGGFHTVEALRWNDSGPWRGFPADNPSPPDVFYGVSVPAHGAGWAVGVGGTTSTPFIERLTSTGWSEVPTPSIGAPAHLVGVDAAPGFALAVGWVEAPHGYRTLIEATC